MMEQTTNTEETMQQPSMLEELLEETRFSSDLLQKQLRITRLLALVLAVLALVLALAGGWMAFTMHTSIGQVDFQMLAEKVERFDVEGLNQAVGNLEKQLAALDVDGVNKSLAQIGAAAESMEGAVDAFTRFQEKMNSFFPW